MITVTKKAKQCLKEVLLDHTDDPEIGVRLTVGSNENIGLVLSKESPGDHVVEHDGSKVLLVGRELATLFAGATLDTKDTPEGIKLVVHKE